MERSVCRGFKILTVDSLVGEGGGCLSVTVLQLTWHYYLETDLEIVFAKDAVKLMHFCLFHSPGVSTQAGWLASV